MSPQGERHFELGDPIAFHCRFPPGLPSSGISQGAQACRPADPPQQCPQMLARVHARTMVRPQTTLACNGPRCLEKPMLKLVSRFVLEVLPAGCAALIAGALLLGHHPLSFGAPGGGARQILAVDGPIASEEIAQRIEDEHAAVTTRNKESTAKPVESRPEPTPVSKRSGWKRPPSFAGLTPPTP